MRQSDHRDIVRDGRATVGMMARDTAGVTPSNQVEYQLLGAVLDGLDDLYDQRERAEMWLERLLVATSVALSGTTWERPMADAAADLVSVVRGGDSIEERNRRALEVTGDLRVQVAQRWAELHPFALPGEHSTT